jgi:hypothetical protein
MPGTQNRPVCRNCQRFKTFELQPGGKTPRTFQCIHCDRPDPLKSPLVVGIVKALKPPE